MSRRRRKVLCWRHHVRLVVAAYGCLLDITGREYPRRARLVFDDAARCARCPYPGRNLAGAAHDAW